MPTTQTWTILPNGRSAAGLRMSVFISHQLDGAGSRLEDYLPASWPDLINQMVRSGF